MNINSLFDDEPKIKCDMKVALLKIGTRISLNPSCMSAGIGEVLSVIKVLQKANIEVHAFTKVLKKDITPPDFFIHDISKFSKMKDQFDCLVVLNGNVNFFGGIEDAEQIENYKIINSYKGKVAYFLCDPTLTLKQIYKSVLSKEWGKKYSEEEIKIVRDDMLLVSQAKNQTLLKSLCKSVPFKDIRYFDWAKFPLLTLQDQNVDPEYFSDVLYGGTFRSGGRKKDMIKFFFGHSEISVEVFGNIFLEQFNVDSNIKAPKFNKPVPYNQYHIKMKEGLSTVVIGDELYKELDNFAPRIYESIRIGNIVFIDISYDKQRKVFEHDHFLKKFCYVTDGKDLANKILYVKKNPEMRYVIIDKQRKIDFNAHAYANELKKMLQE